MKRIVQLSFFVFISFSSSGQKNKSLEISFICRYDRHANYVSNFAGRIYNDTIKLYGISYGVNAIYRQKVAKTLFIDFGIGYYRIGVDKIKGSNKFVPSVPKTSRNINYPDDSTGLLYSTSQYAYNNIAITFGLDKIFIVKDHLEFYIGAEVICYKTFSQKYRLFKSENYYRAENSKPLEFGINLKAGIIRKFRKFYLRPSLVIPIYQNLKGDKVFYENSEMNITKWFNGIGITLAIGKHL